MSLFRILYVSSATRRFDHEALQGLLVKSRANNARDGITGALLYHDSSFFQVLEGPEAAVRGLFARIVQDDWHHAATVLHETAAAAPLFADWTMGWAAPEAFVQAGFDPALLARSRLSDAEVQIWLDTFRRTVRL